VTTALWPLSGKALRRVLHKDGVPVLVIRPDRPAVAVALAIASACLRNNDSEVFGHLPEEVGIEEYTVRGWFGPLDAGKKRATIVDRSGKFLEFVATGDSFISVTKPEALRIGARLTEEN
jgi:hypothetical protein